MTFEESLEFWLVGTISSLDRYEKRARAGSDLKGVRKGPQGSISHKDAGAELVKLSWSAMDTHLVSIAEIICKGILVMEEIKERMGPSDVRL